MGEDGFLDRAYDEGDSAQTHQLYADWADSYDGELTDHGYATPARVADVVGALDVAPTAEIVDLGCGTGLSGAALQAKGFQSIDGCDYSAEMLDVAEATGASAEDIHAALADLGIGEAAALAERSSPGGD